MKHTIHPAICLAALVAAAIHDTALSFPAAPRPSDATTLKARAAVRPSVQVGGVAESAVTCAQPPQNCQVGDTDNALGSNRGFDVVAEDFITTGRSISGLCWWGAYAWDPGTGLVDCLNPGPGDAFEVRYYADNAGIPGTLLAEFTQAGGSLTVSGPTATGAMIDGAFQEYVLTASHAPVPVSTRSRHWVEITNSLTGCEWFWETASQGNQHAAQDGIGHAPVNGYDLVDVIDVDLAFCLDVPMARASNDACDQAELITGSGTFPFDNFSATTDGPLHPECMASLTPQIASDQWYCWTAPFTDRAVVRSCGLTSVDTVIAVYDGCGVCPPTGNELIECSDDRCVDFATQAIKFQSMAAFDALANQSYLIRIGNFTGGVRGVGSFEISSPPPDHVECPGLGDCCGNTGSKACSDDTCCETVCACDPFCCEIVWDAQCAGTGFSDGVVTSGCGAQALCAATCDTCGSPTTGDCCTANGSPSCSDAACCDAVCAVDPYCCTVEWDANCVANNQRVSGADAATLCASLCTCGDPVAGDCCDPAGTGSPGCSNPACCAAVCATDSFCCDNEWDANCSIGYDAARPGALALCQDLCACENTCGDMNGDRSVDLEDLANFTACFAPVPSPWQSCKCADLNLDGSVGLDDYAILVNLIGVGSANSPPNCP